MNDERQQEQNRTNEQFAGFRGKCGRAFAELAAAFGVDAVQRCGDAGEVERLRAEHDLLATSLAAALNQGDKLFDELRLERSKLLAEREPHDNGDGTVTQLLPVTYAAKWSGRALAVRPPKEGELLAAQDTECEVKSGIDYLGHSLRLILSPPVPAKPEPVTWNLSWLRDGEYVVRSKGQKDEVFLCGKSIFTCDDDDDERPPLCGTYIFKNGVGTLQVDQ